MATRTYNNDARRQKQAELTAHMAAAAAGLHAEKGAVATSYADIAERAGVSLPTVYKHFPTPETLLEACTGHAASLAPPLPAVAILGAPDLPAAAQGLVNAMDRLHAYYEPWTAWGEHRVLPALAAIVEAQRRRTTEFIAQVLSRHVEPPRVAELAAVWESLLHFDMWHRLVRVHKLGRAQARRTLLHVLLAVAGPQPAASPDPRPTPRKSK